MRVRGSEGGGVGVGILELSSTNEKYSDPIIASSCQRLSQGYALACLTTYSFQNAAAAE